MDGKRKRKNADSAVADIAGADDNVDEPKTGKTKRGVKNGGGKVPDVVAPADSGDGQEEAKRGRGRPKKSAVKNGDQDLSTAPAPPATADSTAAPRKGRGKSKQNVTDADQDDQDKKPAGRGKRAAKKVADDDDADGDDAPDLKPAVDDKPKRGGRKRKADQDDAADAPADKKATDSAPAPRKGRGKSKQSAAAADGDNDEDEEDKKPASKGSNGAGTSGKEKSMRTITIKGKAPVDQFCSIRDSVHVYCEGDEPYDVMLNQTNVQNNNNKYYVIQLLEDDSGKSYSVWQRWGRVGYDGQNSLNRFGADLEGAKRAFAKKFQDKTCNQWANRGNFVKHGGKYDLVKIDYSSKNEEKPEEKATEPKKKDPPPPSKLPQEVQDLLNMICDIRAMENAVKEMKYDASKAPLGKLTEEQINDGYAALKEIEACIQKKDFGAALTRACNDFYTRIPHYFGMKTPPLIRSMEEVKQKIDLLEALSDIEVALRTLAEGDKEPDNLHPVDKHYDAMKCELKPLDHASDIFKLLQKYLLTTHGSTHTMYKLELLDAFECEKDGEEQRFKDVGNRMLLWHGSRLTNWFGILSQGLRIAPPEAPVTGYMFGKGVYFADMSSKSANYCFTTPQKDVGLLVLCEVALGKTNDLINADYNADKLPKGCSSTKGLGRTVPDEKEFVNLDNGVVVPCGKPKNAGANTTLQYNEYIVYDTSQVKMKYLLKTKFKYNY